MGPSSVGGVTACGEGYGGGSLVAASAYVGPLASAGWASSQEKFANVGLRCYFCEYAPMMTGENTHTHKYYEEF